MPHWRTLVKSEHFCAADLWDDRSKKYLTAAVKIVKVAGGKVVGKKGSKKEMPFLSLEDRNGNPLRAPLGVNPTNCTTISSVVGSPDYVDWVGQWIGLYVTKVDGPEGMVDAIRINPKPVPEEFKRPPAQAGEQPKPAQGSPAAAAEMTEEEKREIMERERREAAR